MSHINHGYTATFPASEEFMGRLQQITIAAAQATHEVRRIITDITGGGQVPAFSMLDHDLRNQAIERASQVLGSMKEPSDVLDEIIWLVAEEIQMLDGEASDAATVEQINARVPEDIAATPDPMKTVAPSPFKIEDQVQALFGEKEDSK